MYAENDDAKQRQECHVIYSAVCVIPRHHHVLLHPSKRNPAPPHSLSSPLLLQPPSSALSRRHPVEPCLPHQFLLDCLWSLERRVPRGPRRYSPLDLQACVTPNLVPTGTVVATLVSPIGSYFNKSEQSSYLGTSYLLSVCCFTPLYGQHLRSFPPPPAKLLSGRLSDILGRKGAMLLALTLFGPCRRSRKELLLPNPYQALVQSPAVSPLQWRRSFLPAPSRVWAEAGTSLNRSHQQLIITHLSSRVMTGRCITHVPSTKNSHLQSHQYRHH